MGRTIISATPIARAAHQGTGAGPHQVQERRSQFARPAAARGHGARLPGRFQGPRAVHRRGPIDHTPKDETMDLHIGNAFDVVSERKQTDYQKLGSNTYEMAFEISLRNHKRTPITVEVNEPIGGDWTMVDSNFKYNKTAAFAARFTVPVAANGESVLKYRVRVRW